MLLRDSLGGSARTAMLTHVRESARHFRQTMLTLAFASRAKRITNKVVVRDAAAAAAEAEAGTAADAAQRRALEDRIELLAAQQRDASSAVAAAAAENQGLRRALEAAKAQVEARAAELGAVSAALGEAKMRACLVKHVALRPFRHQPPLPPPPVPPGHSISYSGNPIFDEIRGGDVPMQLNILCLPVEHFKSRNVPGK